MPIETSKGNRYAYSLFSSIDRSGISWRRNSRCREHISARLATAHVRQASLSPDHTDANEDNHDNDDNDDNDDNHPDHSRR